MSKPTALAVFLGLATGLVAQLALGEEQPNRALVVEKGRSVSIEYSLLLDDGSTADSNVGGEALKFTQGEQMILPSLESALEGLQVGESKSVRLTPEEGYGVVNPDAFIPIGRAQIPEDAHKVGTILLVSDGQGNQHRARVHEIRDEQIVLDLNHPLAGQHLNFEVRILAID